MNLGILNAFPLESSKTNWERTPVDAYIRFFECVDAPFVYTPFNVAQGEFPDTVDSCDAYLITGSPRGVYDTDPWIADLMHFIRDSYEAGKKLVGICFGHQILAHALGGHTEKSAKGWGLGRKQFAVTTQKPWMTKPPGSYELYFVHQDQVLQLPAAAERLAGNDFCPNAMFVMANQVLGVQGHPEFTEPIMQDILAEKDDTISPEILTQAVDSLQMGTPDNDVFAQWLVNFLTA